MRKIISLFFCLTLLLTGCAKSRDKSSDDGTDGTGGVWAIEKSAPQELKPVGRMRGNIARFMRVDIGTVELAAHTVARFDLTGSEENAALRFLLISVGPGEVVEGSVTGSGGVTLKVNAAGTYVLTLENLSELDVYFTVDYAFGGTPI